MCTAEYIYLCVCVCLCVSECIYFCVRIQILFKKSMLPANCYTQTRFNCRVVNLISNCQPFPRHKVGVILYLVKPCWNIDIRTLDRSWATKTAATHEQFYGMGGFTIIFAKQSINLKGWHAMVGGADWYLERSTCGQAEWKILKSLRNKQQGTRDTFCSAISNFQISSWNVSMF